MQNFLRNSNEPPPLSRMKQAHNISCAEYHLRKYGMRKIRFHDLRHTCASLLVAKNINMKIIPVWLGHSNMSTTADIYSHLDANAKSEAGRAIESVLSINTESED